MTQVTHSIFGSVGEPAKSEDKQKTTDLKSLIELGTIIEDVQIGGHTFTLKTPPFIERVRLSSTLNTNKEVSEEDVVNFQINVLAHSLEKINGIPLEDWHPDKNMDPIIRRVEIISTFQAPVISSLTKKYKEIVSKCDMQFDVEQIKK